MDVLLHARGLRKAFGPVRAVDGVDLTVHAGEAVGLLGPNGAGKTTTLLMLLGAITPDAGSVTVVGHRLPAGRSRAMTRVGFAAGYLPLPEALQVGEYLRMYGELYGLPDPRPGIAAGLERFGIADLAGVQGIELSSGQRTLVGIVKATLHRPRLLVLDEPTASLDPDVALRVRTGLQELARSENVALLMSSHNMVEVERLCDRVVFLSAGRVIAEGAPSHVAAHFGRGDLEEVFIHLAGDPDMPAMPEPVRPAAPVHDPGAPAAADVPVAPAPAPPRGAGWLRVRAIARRNAYILKRKPYRLFDVTIWPLIDVVLFGSLAAYFADAPGPGGVAAGYLLGGVLLWHVVYQTQINLATGFLEESWSRQLVSLMVTPLTETEFAAGVALFGMVKLALGTAVVALAAAGFYAFNVFGAGLALVPIAAILLVLGWVIALFVIALTLRFGSGAEALAWGILFILLPLSGVFYPVDALPPLLRPISLALPTTHAFAAGRALLDGDGTPWGQLALAAAGTVVAVVVAVAFLRHMLDLFRRRGYISRYA